MASSLRALLSRSLPAAAIAASTLSAAAEPSWPEVKCARYRQAWTELLARRGPDGLGAAFLGSHEAFLDSGCTARAEVCPRSKAELDVANILVIRAMNAGMASTFPPFACRKEGGG